MSYPELTDVQAAAVAELEVAREALQLHLQQAASRQQELQLLLAHRQRHAALRREETLQAQAEPEPEPEPGSGSEPAPLSFGGAKPLPNPWTPRQ
jgi:hypothetical protein